MTDADLDKLEALAKSATQGEWRAWITRRRQPEIYTDGGSSEQNDKIASGVLRKADAAFIAGANPATILDLIASARRDAEEIERLRIAIEGEKLNYDGAISDLESALQVLARRINGEKDLDSARTWLELNYPDFAASALTARAAHTGEG